MSPDAEISYHADCVEIIMSQFAPDFTVIGFHLGEGDPEQGGQHWNFTQSVPPEEGDFAGVCTVKEIQQVTVYGGIRRFHIWPDHLVCEFDERTAPATGACRLRGSHTISPEKWEELSQMAERIFEGHAGFQTGRPDEP
ncbi:MAG: hypothetical protein ACAI34_03865 [Verrucomicrobium sp.]|nr:hypothetical protein [Verrucomicrobium sp.]